MESDSVRFRLLSKDLKLQSKWIQFIWRLLQYLIKNTRVNTGLQSLFLREQIGFAADLGMKCDTVSVKYLREGSMSRRAAAFICLVLFPGRDSSHAGSNPSLPCSQIWPKKTAEFATEVNKRTDTIPAVYPWHITSMIRCVSKSIFFVICFLPVSHSCTQFMSLEKNAHRQCCQQPSCTSRLSLENLVCGTRFKKHTE